MANGPSPFELSDRLPFGFSSSSKSFPFCSRCSRIFRANVRNAFSMLIFCLQETSKNGISKFSAICEECERQLDYNEVKYQLIHLEHFLIPLHLYPCLPYVVSVLLRICFRPVLSPRPVPHSEEKKYTHFVIRKRCFPRVIKRLTHFLYIP